MLQELAHITGIGRVYFHRRRGLNPTGLWAVNSTADRKIFVEILDGFTPRGRKGREYAVWRRGAVDPTLSVSALTDLSCELVSIRSYP